MEGKTWVEQSQNWELLILKKKIEEINLAIEKLKEPKFNQARWVLQGEIRRLESNLRNLEFKLSKGVK